MSDKMDKSEQIVHEAELTRQHARYKIPSTIEIEGKQYKVHDWSVSGIAIEGIPESIYEKNHVIGKMSFRFDDFETIIDNLNIEFIIKKSDGISGARFTELTPQQISILNQIISAYLAGDIVTEDDILHAVTRANFMKKKETKANIDTKKSILVLVILWSFVLLLILFLSYLMYQRTYIIKTENAYVDTNMTIIRAPSPSYIEFAQYFKKNEDINTSEVLMYAHIMYGGIKIVHSPLTGKMFKIMIHNGDFRNVGEPVFAILPKHYQVYIVAHILHKDLVKVSLGDIANVSLPNGDKFYAKIIKIKFPYSRIEKHAKPLQNVYNQARNFDELILQPINYNPNVNLVGTSVVVTINTFLNKHKWYSIKEENQTQAQTQNISNNEKNNEKIIPVVKEKKVVKEQKQPKKIVISNSVISEPKSMNQSVHMVNKYCIIATSSKTSFKSQKDINFVTQFPKARIVKVGNIYEIKLSYYNSYQEAKNALNDEVKNYYNDAFIIKCKVKNND